MKIVWSHNWFLEYRVAVFEAMEKNFSQFSIIYASRNLSNAVQKQLEDRVSMRYDVVKDFRIELRLPNSRSNFANKVFGVSLPFGLPKLLWKLKPDILVGEGFFRWGLIHLIFKPILGYKYVMCYERTRNTERKAPQFVTWLRRRVLFLIDDVIVNGSETETYLRDLGWKKEVYKVHMVPEKRNFLHLKPTEHSESVCKFLFIGQLVERKGIKQLLCIWKELCKRSPKKLFLEVVGDGPLLDELNYFDNVSYCGKVPFEQLDDYFRRAHFLVMPTLEDNWSMVVPEALAASTPAISTYQNGGSQELLLKSGLEAGFVYESLDAEGMIDVFLEAIDLTNEDYRKMTENCKKVDSLYNLDKVVENFNKICSKY